MITLTNLSWNNWFSYGVADNSINLSENRLLQLIGENGTGKSSIAFIIEEILFNKNSKKIPKGDILNRCTKEDYFDGTLEFTKDNDDYQVSVHRRKTLKVTLTKNGKDISSHTATNTYKTIQEIIGLDFNVFSQLIYQSSTSSLQFLTATDSVRKAFLIDLFNLEQYSKIGKYFSDNFLEMQSRVQKYNAEKEFYESRIEEQEKNIPEPKEIKDVPLELYATIRDYQSQLDKLYSKAGEIKAQQEQAKKYNDKKRTLEKVEKYLEDAEVLPIRKPPRVIELDMEQLQERRRNMEKELVLLKIGSCPLCYNGIDEALHERIKVIKQSDIKQIGNILDRLRKEYEESNSATSNNLHIKKMMQKAEQLREELGDAITCEERDVSEELKEVRRKHKEASDKAKRLEADKHKAEIHNSNRSLRFSMIKEQKAALANLKAPDMKTLKALEVLAKAFGKKGLINHKIENLVQHLQTLINNYLVRLSDGRFNVSFRVENEKLNVKINDAGREISVASLSSGEFARINCATLLGIRKLLNSISSSKINLLILDEVINVLDENGRQILTEVLSDENLNTILVSHGWTHPLLQKIEVKKENGVSRIDRF